MVQGVVFALVRILGYEGAFLGNWRGNFVGLERGAQPCNLGMALGAFTGEFGRILEVQRKC